MKICKVFHQQGLEEWSRVMTCNLLPAKCIVGLLTYFGASLHIHELLQSAQKSCAHSAAEAGWARRQLECSAQVEFLQSGLCVCLSALMQNRLSTSMLPLKYFSASVKDTSYVWGPKMTPPFVTASCVNLAAKYCYSKELLIDRISTAPPACRK